MSPGTFLFKLHRPVVFNYCAIVVYQCAIANYFTSINWPKRYNLLITANNHCWASVLSLQ